MNEDLFEMFKCSRCGTPVRSKYKAAPGEKLDYFCSDCGRKAYAERMKQKDVDPTMPGRVT